MTVVQHSTIDNALVILGKVLQVLIVGGDDTDGEFRQFESMEWGYRAMFVLLYTYAVKYDCSTLRQMIERYAPPSENHTENYIRRVAYATHLSPEEIIFTKDGATMTAVVAAMSEVENGVEADMTEVWGGWRLFIADFPPK